MAKLKSNQFILNGRIITEIPLLFQKPLVQANLEDRKSQTRRTRGLDEMNEHPNEWNRIGDPKKEICRFWDSTKETNPNPLRVDYGFKPNSIYPTSEIVYKRCPYGKPGDLLWVRETWGIDYFGSLQPWHFKEGLEIKMKDIIYKATSGRDYGYDDNDAYFLLNKKWKPSIHMPKAASRLWLMVEEIRVERVRDISEEDAVAEGIEGYFEELFQEMRWKDYNKKTPGGWWRSPRSSFQTLWMSINGQASLAANPWVWAIKYRILSKTGRPSDEVILKNYKQITHA